LEPSRAARFPAPLAAAGLATLLCLPAPAAGQTTPDRDSGGWRIGLVAHNLHLRSSELQSGELGPNLELEIFGARPRNLAWLGHPKVYGELSGNLNGDTSFASAGFLWTWRLSPTWWVEPGLGLAVHDGALDNPFPVSDQRNVEYQHDHQLLGTRWLFRDSLALEHDIGGGHSLGLVFEHLSNGGKVFGHDDNQSLNELGLRYTTRFR
jgi:hypothetical protein